MADKLRTLFRSSSRATGTPDEKSRVGNLSKTTSLASEPLSEMEDRRSDTVSVCSSPEKRPKHVLEKLLTEQRLLLEEKKMELQKVLDEEDELKAKQRELHTSVEGQSICGESSEDEDKSDGDRSFAREEEQFGFGPEPTTAAGAAAAAALVPEIVTPKKPLVDGRQGSISSVSSANSRRMTEPHRPSTTQGRRTVTIARRTPDEALGFDLRSVALPVGSVRDGIDKDKLRQATFVDGLSVDSIAYRAGLRRGDQLLEIDGESCDQAKQDAISRLLSRNRGTVILTVRTTSDFQRALQFEKYLGQLRLLKEKKQQLGRVMAEEQELTQFYSESKYQQERRIRAAQSLDLCTAPVLGMPLLCEDLPLLVRLMQAQWQAERRDGIAPERPPSPLSETDSEDGEHGTELQVTVV